MVTKNNEKPHLTEDDRKKAIDNFVKAKKKSVDSTATDVKPAKVPPTKIPAAANVTTGKSKKELRKANEAKRDDVDTVTVKASKESKVKAAVDAELDESVKPKKKEVDPNLLSVSDVARELGLDPKRARAKLRSAGQSSNEGRWSKVKRDSKEHKELVAMLTPAPKVEDEGADDDIEEEVEADDDIEG